MHRTPHTTQTQKPKVFLNINPERSKWSNEELKIYEPEKENSGCRDTQRDSMRIAANNQTKQKQKLQKSTILFVYISVAIHQNCVWFFFHKTRFISHLFKRILISIVFIR